ncbi:MAG: dipeptide epimerase, partial [Actinomycetota bacterium]|nr:dipeptide epimerase [Actinomycetota bacterium]
IKLGGGDGLDLDRLRAVRTVTTTPVVVDVNERWTLAEAQDILPRLAEFDVVLVEQPLPAHDPDAELLARQSSLPIYLDEECSSAADVARSADRAHGVNLKLSKCGGIRELLAASITARAHGLHIMIGCDLESSLGITAAAHLASIADHVDLDGNLLLAEDPWNGADLVDGVQIPPADPGLGVHALAAHRITEGVGNAPNGP